MQGQAPYGQQAQGQRPYGQSAQGQAPYGQQGQFGQQQLGVGQGRLPGGGGGEGQAEDSNRRARLIGAVGLVMAALLVTGFSVNWIWDKADAVNPVALPSAKPEPMTTISPSVKPTTPPPPEGKVLGSNIVAFNNDTMPLMGSAWSDDGREAGQYGAGSIWLRVHKDYGGK
jgi:hypothetical protein